jgi:hypothetical protein
VRTPTGDLALGVGDVVHGVTVDVADHQHVDVVMNVLSDI